MATKKVTPSMYRIVLLNSITEFLMEAEMRQYQKVFDKMLAEIKRIHKVETNRFIYKGLLYISPTDPFNQTVSVQLPKSLNETFQKAIAQKEAANREVTIATRSIILAVPYQFKDMQVVRDSLPFDLYNEVFNTDIPRQVPCEDYVRFLSPTHRKAHEKALQVVRYYQTLRLVY